MDDSRLSADSRRNTCRERPQDISGRENGHGLEAKPLESSYCENIEPSVLDYQLQLPLALSGNSNQIV